MFDLEHNKYNCVIFVRKRVEQEGARTHRDGKNHIHEFLLNAHCRGTANGAFDNNNDFNILRGAVNDLKRQDAITVVQH